MNKYLCITTLILCLIFVLPQDTFAATHVTVYFAGGIVVGGVSIFFSILIGGDRPHSKKEKKDNEDNIQFVMQAYNYKASHFSEEDLQQAGMVKILEW